MSNNSLENSIQRYAQNCVDDMDIESLMSIAYDSIVDRLEDLPAYEVKIEIADSAYPEILDEMEEFD